MRFHPGCGGLVGYDGVCAIFTRAAPSPRPPSPCATLILENKHQTNVSALVVFSKSYCPYCKSTKKVLSDLGADFKALELDQLGMYPLLLGGFMIARG